LIVATPVPRQSFDGKVNKTFANIALSSREWEGADLAASYTFDRRHNISPMDLYSYIPGDSQDQAQPSVPGVSRYIRFNLPHSFRFQKLKAEAGYRPVSGTRLSIAYLGDFKKRDFQQVAKSSEHTVTAKALTTVEQGSAWVSAAYIRRSGSKYIDNVSWNASHTLNYLNGGSQNQSIEYPLLFKYYLADRKRSEFKGGMTFDAGEHLAFSASGGRARDNYFRSLFGLRRARSLLADGDVSYSIENLLTASAYYSYERFSFDQKGYYIATLNLSNPSQEWTARNRDSVNTAGARLEWRVIPDRLNFSASYSVSEGTTAIDVQATGFVPLANVVPLPDAYDRTHHLGIKADYRLRPDLSLQAGYVFENHLTRDWAYDSVSITPVSQLLGSGIVSPRYNAHVVTVATHLAF
jgi:MtrB/PioB family decaheme-associated outer membrane protein